MRFAHAPSIALAFLAAVVLAIPVESQVGSEAKAPAERESAANESLIVSVSKIRKQLVLPGKVGASPFRYNFEVEVVGKQPKIDFFQEFNLSKYSGVEYGAPTHMEILNTVTPMGFRMYPGMSLLPRKK